MKPIIPLLLLFIASLMTMAYATGVSSDSPDFMFSPSQNYEYDSQSVSWIDTESLSGASGHNHPVICDSDEDGNLEVHVYSGRTVSVYGMDSENVFGLESTLTFPNVGNLNALGCADLVGDSVNKDILFGHQGTTNGSSYITFVEHDPDWVGVSSPSGTIGNEISNDYYLGGYINGTIDADSQFYCSKRSSGWSSSGEYECVIGNAKGFALTSWSEWADSGDGNRFPLLDHSSVQTNLYQNASLTLDYETDTAGNPGSPNQESAMVLIHGGTPDRYVYFEDNSKIIKVTIDGANPSSWVQADDPGEWRGASFLGWIARGDYSDDGSDDVCLASGSNDAFSYTGYLSCINPADDTETYYSALAGGNGNYWASITGFDTDGDGNANLCFARYDNTGGGAVSKLGCFQGNNGDFVGTLSGAGAGRTTSIARVRGQDNFTVIATGSTLFFYNETNNSVEDSTTLSGGMTFFTDLNNDFIVEVVSYDESTGSTTLYSLADLITSGTITLKNPTQTGDGYFGWFAGDNCNGTITFEATECVGSDTDCTYNSTSSSSKERLCSTCGGVQNLTCGAYSFAHPTIDCSIPTPGTYNFTMYIESDFLPGYYQAQMSPDLQLNITDGLEGSTCNILGSQIESPDDITDGTTTEENATAVPDTETFNPEKPGYFGDTFGVGWIQICQVETDNHFYNLLHMVTLCNSTLQMLVALILSGVVATGFLIVTPSQSSPTVAVIAGIISLIFFSFIYFISWYFPVILAVIFIGVEIIKGVFSSGAGAR